MIWVLLIIVLSMVPIACLKIKVTQTDKKSLDELTQGMAMLFGSSSEKPEIVSFIVDTPDMAYGDVATLQWFVAGATEVIIDPAVGPVGLVGSQRVAPPTTTVYTLTASNDKGNTSQSLIITIDGSSQPSAKDELSLAPLPKPSTDSTQPSSSTSTSSSIPPPTITPPPTSSPTPPKASASTYAPPVSPPVISYFSANPSTIYAGNASTLSWDVYGASSVYLDHGGGYVPAYGDATARLYTTTVFTLTATNGAGTVARQVLITVLASTPVPTTPSTPAAAPSSPPVINYFTPNPSSISAGGSSTLSWSVTGATSVSIDHGAGYVSASGTATAKPSATSTYTLTAQNSAGKVTKSVTVTVAATAAPAPAPAPSGPTSPPTINSFSASPASIIKGNSSTLSWNVSGAATISINNGVGNVASSGSKVVTPTASTSYTVTATNTKGSASKTVTVPVTTPAPLPPSPPAASASTCEQSLFNAVNSLRTGAGKPALTKNSYIDGLCRQHAQYMASKGTVSHDNFIPTRSNAVMSNVAGMHTTGENVLQGNSPCNASSLAQLWWNSPGHKANILGSQFTVAGMGVFIDASGKIWACQIFAGP